MLRFSSFLVCSVLLLAPAMARAETGSDVMDRVYKQADIFPNSEAEVRLVVKNKKGGERERFFYLRAKNDATTKKSLVKFFKPANVKGVGLASKLSWRRATNRNLFISRHCAASRNCPRLSRMAVLWGLIFL